MVDGGVHPCNGVMPPNHPLYLTRVPRSGWLPALRAVWAAGAQLRMEARHARAEAPAAAAADDDGTCCTELLHLPGAVLASLKVRDSSGKKKPNWLM